MIITKGMGIIRKVYRATSKKKSPPKGKGKISKKYQGRYFVDYKKVAKDLAKNIPTKKDRLILKADLTPKEHNVGKKLFMKFVPDKFGSYGGGKPSRFGRVILPKTAIKKVKVDRKLTREVRKK